MPQGNRVAKPGEEKPKRRRQPKNDDIPAAAPIAAAIGLAGFDFEAYNRQYTQRPSGAAFNDAEAYGARVETLQAQPGQSYWKVIGIHHLAPDENRDRHNAFVEVLDEGGHRVKDNNLRVGSIWEGKTDGPDRPKPLDKPDNEPAADVPIEKNMTMTIWLEGAGPSERVTNLHTRHEDEVGPGGGRNSRFHHSYYIVFQRAQGGATHEEHGETGGETGDETGGETGGHTGGNGAIPPAQAFRFLRWPTDHLKIIQPFGANPQIYKDFGFPGHEGVDIVASENEPIYCVAPGVVKMVNTLEAYLANKHPYGVHVRVQHQDGYETIYAHFKEQRVAVDEVVAAGQILGLADHTGNVFGDPADHLHLTLKHTGESAPGYRNNVIDPTPFLLPLLQPGAGPAAPAGFETPQVRVAQKLGLNCNAPTDGSGNITPRLADPRLIRETGVEWVRLNFIVRGFSGPDDPRWIDTYRRIIAGLRGQGLQIYGLLGVEAVVDDPGNQFRDSPPAGAVDNEWIRAYARNVRRIVELFGQDIAVVESFNEPNNWHRTGDGVQWEKAWIDPGWFAIMLQAVYDAVRGLPITLVSGPLLSTQDGNDAANYLLNVYRAGSDRFGWGQPDSPVPFDGIAFHPYVASNPENPQTEIPAKYRQYMREVRDVIARFDAPGKPLYLSEMGWQNAEDRQPACMEAGLTCALDDPTVALCFWYGMQDDAGESYGLYRRDGLTPGHRKPIFDRFVALATNPRSVPVAGVLTQRPNARFIAELDSTPDGSVLQPQSSFTKIWQMANTGATTWGEGYQFVLIDGPALGAQHRMPVPPCRPGQNTEIRVSFTTPPDPGQYKSTWSLADAQGNLFGPRVWTEISVAVPVAAPAAVGLAAMPAPATAALPGLALFAGMSPLAAAAMGIIYQTYWLRVLAAAAAPDAQQAIQSAGDDAVTRIQALMVSE